MRTPHSLPKRVVALGLILVLVSAGCGTSGLEVAPPPPHPGTLSAGLGTAEQASFTAESSTTLSTSAAPGWTVYVSINDIDDLAFAPDGTVWAATGGGLIHWSLGSDTYTRYPTFADYIRDVAVGPDGALWLATGQGITRLDGMTIETYTTTHGLIHDLVRTVEVASDGVVWVGTDGGVSRFDGESWRSFPAPVPIEDLTVAANGEVWVATSQGVGRYLPAQDAWTTYSEEHGLPSPPQAQVVAAEPGGDVWAFILWQGVYRFDGTNWQEAEEISGGIVTDIAVAPDGIPWVAVGGGWHFPGSGLAYWDGRTWVPVTSEDSLGPITTVALGQGGEIAAGTNLGLGIYQEGEWRLLRDGPAHERATSVAVTPDGTVWLGFGDNSASTRYPGLSRFDGQGWQYLMEEAEVYALAVAPDGALWAAVGCDVLRFDGSAWDTVARCGEHLSSGPVGDIVFTPDGAAWFANGFSLARFDGQSWTLYDKAIGSLMVAPDGAIWMNGWEGQVGSAYLARFDGERWTTYRLTDSFPGTFMAEAVTGDGRVWGVVPERGLACFDGRSWKDSRSWTFYPPPEGLSLDRASSLAVAPDGALWLSTPDGIGRFEPPTGSATAGETASGDGWTVYSTRDSPTDRYSSAIAFAPDGAIWFGTTRFQPAQVEGTQ